MSRWGELARVGVVALFATAAISTASAPLRYGFGQPATPLQVVAWDIDVRPDGAGLPGGRGSVSAGQSIYDRKCASCHGTFGESNAYMAIAGGVGTLGSDQSLRTTGSKLNFATTLWDYINRAMPFEAPKSLTPDEVYALTAYVLHLNDIVPADAVLDQHSLPQVKMPNRDGFTTRHGFMRRDGTPDTRNVACMDRCVADVRVISRLPDYAIDEHGDLALQSRVFATAPAPTTANAGASLARASGCIACHGVTEKRIGPTFREVAAKYAGADAAEPGLVAKVREGSTGAWGSVPMPAQAQLTVADTRVVVQWILAGAR